MFNKFDLTVFIFNITLFYMKINLLEIPLFHVMNAQISFNNIFATQNAVHGVTVIRDEERLMCDIDESLFEPPSHYTFIGTDIFNFNILLIFGFYI